MRSFRTLSSLFIGLFIAVSLTQAQTPLSGAKIDSWISSMRDLQKWSEQHQDEFDVLGEGGPQNLEAAMASLSKHDREVQRILKRHGFDDSDAWAETGGRIFNAFLALQMRGVASEMEAQINAAMREIDNNPNLSEDQKNMMREQMKLGMQYHQQMSDAPADDIRAVESRKAKLETFFDE